MAVDKTFVPKGKVEADWILIDAAGQGIGRMATQIAGYLMGKHKAIYTPGVEMGDAVVVINASQLKITGKRLDEKNYYHHSNYPGGLRTTNLRDQMKNHPDRVIRAAVWGMLPHNKLGRQLIKNLKIFNGPEHKHQAQNPKVIEGA
jgi:large subunit ribosomal protein L13